MESEDEDGETAKPFKVSHNYYINEDPKPVVYVMISDAEDLYRRIQELMLILKIKH